MNWKRRTKKSHQTSIVTTQALSTTLVPCCAMTRVVHPTLQTAVNEQSLPISVLTTKVHECLFKHKHKVVVSYGVKNLHTVGLAFEVVSLTFGHRNSSESDVRCSVAPLVASHTDHVAIGTQNHYHPRTKFPRPIEKSSSVCTTNYGVKKRPQLQNASAQFKPKRWPLQNASAQLKIKRRPLQNAHAQPKLKHQLLPKAKCQTSPLDHSPWHGLCLELKQIQQMQKYEPRQESQCVN